MSDAIDRLAVISDVHADVHALRDAIAQIDQIGIKKIVCCGDLVDYGLFPEETLALMRDRGIQSVRGNHDRWAVNEGRDMSGWDLSAASMTYLEKLPTLWTSLGSKVIVVAHARPTDDGADDMNGISPKAPGWELALLLDIVKADILIVGHTHVPFIRHVGKRFVMNPGALLRDPAPGVDVQTPGTFATIKIDDDVPQIEVRRAKDGAIVMQYRTKSDLPEAS